MKAMSPLFAPSTSAPSSRLISSPPMSQPMPPTLAGTSMRWWRTGTESPPFRSRAMNTKTCLMIPMARPLVRKACACIRPSSSGTPTAFVPNVFAVPCSFLSAQARSVTMTNRPLAEAVSKVPKDPNWEKGGLMRGLLDRESPLYHAVYAQRMACLPHQ
jgi:hypothetical protein